MKKTIKKYFCRQDFAQAAGYVAPVTPEEMEAPAFAQDGYGFLADADGNVAAFWL